MEWYKRYLKVYNKPFTEAFYPICTTVKDRISQLQSEQPIATVSVIAYNEEQHLLACLWSLSEMVCKYPIEIIGVNNDSTDCTQLIFERCGIPFFTEMQHSPGFARNCGLEHTRGKYHICIDSDSLYPQQYIETYIETLAKKEVVGCYGLWSFLPDENHSKIQLAIYEFLRDFYLKIQNIKRPELNVRGMTFAFKMDLNRKIKFRTDIIRGEDGSLALELKKHGKLVFLTNKKTRIITDNNTMNADGSMMQSFIQRIKKAIKNGISIFHRKNIYEDEDSNLIK